MQFTKEQLTERARRKVKELEFAITQSAFTSIRDGLNEELELARIALASLDAKPIYQYQSGIYNDDNGETDWYWDDCDAGFYKQYAADRRRIVYTAQPVQETGIYKDMLNIISLLENNEWAEHCTSTVLGSLLESEITRLVGKEQSAPVVPDDWVMVPKEPTRQMMAQGHFAMKGTDRGKFRRIYQAMITAASALNKGEY
ncbi:hypothetical protein ACHR9M_000013 [Salmonella enterica]|nr:hypothetical protein [Salmonella enterica]